MTATPIPTCDYTLIVYTIVVHYMVLLTRYERGGGSGFNCGSSVNRLSGGKLPTTTVKKGGTLRRSKGEVEEKEEGEVPSLHLQTL